MSSSTIPMQNFVQNEMSFYDVHTNAGATTQQSAGSMQSTSGMHTTLELSGTLTDATGRPLPTSSGGEGAASNFIRRRGFGWMLEVEEDDHQQGGDGGKHDNIWQRPLLEELDIDLADIAYKLKSVALPSSYFGLNRERIRESPDFWGPLLVVLAFALVSLYGQLRVVSWIITMWLVGSCFVFVIVRSLGANVTYAQCLGIIGYSLFPMLLLFSVWALVSAVIGGQQNTSSSTTTLIGQLLKLLGLVWSSVSAASLLCFEELDRKKPLIFYPVGLLFVYFYSLYTGA